MVQESKSPMDTNNQNPASPEPEAPTDNQPAGNVQPAEDLAQQLDELRQELDSAKDKYLRALADCQNIQKRYSAERVEAAHRAQGEVAKALLPVLDNFERTLQAAKDATDVRVLADGVRIVYEQMLKALAEFGVQRMDLKPGDPFDPAYHQAVAQQPSDQIQPEHVLHVAQPGYTMRDKVLRPAAVVVARQPAEQASE